MNQQQANGSGGGIAVIPPRQIACGKLAGAQLPDGSMSVQVSQDMAIVYSVARDGSLKRGARVIAKLSEAKGHICKIGGAYMLQAAGHDFLNSALGLKITIPETVNGNPNPARERDRTSKALTAVSYCVELSGPDLQGREHVIVQHFVYNVHDYVVGRIISKAQEKKGYQGKPPTPPLKGFSFMNTEEAKSIDTSKNLVFPLDAHAAMAIEFGSPAFFAYIGESVQCRKFAERTALTIARRLAYERHPLTPMKTVKAELVPNGILSLDAFFWMADDDGPKESAEKEPPIVHEFHDDADIAPETVAEIEPEYATAEGETIDPETGEVKTIFDE